MSRRFNTGYYISEGVHSIFTHGFTQDDAASVMLQWTVNRYQWDLNTAPADKAQALMDEIGRAHV